MFNRTGSRFTSESPDTSYAQGNDLIAQEGQLGWFLFDASTQPRLVIADPMAWENEYGVPTLDELESTGQLIRADNLSELAQQIGMSSSGLLDSIEEFNRTLSEELDDPFWGEVPEMDPIETSPFYAIRIVPALAKAFGGISVDTGGRVIDRSGGTIPGLFAAGELTGMAGGTLVGEGQFTTASCPGFRV